MSIYTIRAVATPRRLAWLRECRDHAPADRAGRHHTAYHCARLGWTQWVFLADEFNALQARIVGEELTDEGRAVLNAAKEVLPMDSLGAILKTANEGLDRIIDERDAAIAQVALLRQACIEARQWILHNDDLENDSADWPLHLIRKALKASGEPSESFPMTRALLSAAKED